MVESFTRISTFLRTCVSQAPERDAVSSVQDWFALRSHPGLVRPQNEDRVALAQWIERGEPCWIVGVADGIGSGKAGAEAASVALACLIAALIDSTKELGQRLTEATERANRAVYERWRGREGTTLSAVMVRGQRAALVNVGDSRIYGVDREGKTTLLTQDDTMPTIPGLLQFVGMGTDLAPHVHDVTPDLVGLLLTSDGAHHQVDALFPHLVRTAKGDTRAVVDRIIHIATWCGGSDNATAAMVLLAHGAFSSAPGIDLDLWTPGMHHVLPQEPSSRRTSVPRPEPWRSRRDHGEPSQRDRAPTKARPHETAASEVLIRFADAESPEAQPEVRPASPVIATVSNAAADRSDAGSADGDRPAASHPPPVPAVALKGTGQ